MRKGCAVNLNYDTASPGMCFICHIAMWSRCGHSACFTSSDVMRLRKLPAWRSGKTSVR